MNFLWNIQFAGKMWVKNQYMHKMLENMNVYQSMWHMPQGKGSHLVFAIEEHKRQV